MEIWILTKVQICNEGNQLGELGRAQFQPTNFGLQPIGPPTQPIIGGLTGKISLEIASDTTSFMVFSVACINSVTYPILRCMLGSTDA